MNTDYIPKSAAEKEEYWRSDAMRDVALPPSEPLRTLAARLKSGLAADDKKEVQAACVSMLKELSAFYQVSTPKISILSTRPLKVTEKWVQELFGDYTPDTEKIRLWMRTAVQKKPTSYGVLLSTFCHEFFHHLDMVSLDLPETYHTRGFYERVGLLYHHIQNTPVRKIVWKENRNGTYQVDWAKTMANRPVPDRPDKLNR
ncbi:MAG: hypothetical protein KGS72_23940 [Cyanobacteria bacterium REEB67]|nr:hypothetical protein [Cyanobacteria bacterium REEB67]